MIEGSNFAECHPVGFRWVMEARRRGATVIHVDPRFTRTSAMADVHVPIRAGSDIAFLGGLVNHILTNQRYFRDYVVNYTNAAAIVREDFRDTEDLDGLFSGFDPEAARYDPTSWAYEGMEVLPAAGARELASPEAEEHGTTAGRPAERDPSLEHPRCVFQILKRHFSRYTPEMVQEVCGIDPALFERIAETICANSGRDRTTAFAYSVGWTQHSKGVQYIRTAAIVQLLLGNIGRPGGGIIALRGHASIQGSTDIPTLYDLLPGYLEMPAADEPDVDSYLRNNTARTGWWSNFPKYFVSLQRAWWGDAAREDTGWAYDHLPRLTGDHSHMTTVADMADGGIEGYFVMGENPVVGSMHGALQRKGLRELKWLVVRDLVLTETADFWRQGPEIERGEVEPEDIGTEVFFFPAAAHVEKDGSFTNAHRLLQWHWKAVEPSGDRRSELHFMYHLGDRIRRLYAGSSEERDRPIHDLTWTYPTSGPDQEPSAEAILAEIGGCELDGGRPVSGFAELSDDGSTACGCWIYSGCYADGVNQPARKRSASEQSWVAADWGWAWPDNRRILYNRASADPEGRPWSERKALVWWDEDEGRWTGHDTPDFIADRDPTYRPGSEDRAGTASLAGTDAFIMQTDGKAWLYAPGGLLDGPLPTHYEPQESPVANPLYGQQCNPARLEWRRRDNPYHRAFDDPRFPYPVTTYRLTEHHTAGGMSRWLGWLSELQPEAFCEIGPELAEDKGLRNGGWATISTARGEIELRVLVTDRIPSLKIRGRTLHQIGLPYHWGYSGRSRGDIVNDLIGFVADPNVSIQESKALTADIRAGRRDRGRRTPPRSPRDGVARDLHNREAR